MKSTAIDYVNDELKMLRVIKRLKQYFSIPIKATFLGRYAFPKVFKENRQGYIDLIIEKMLPKITEENLANYIDVFCEKGYFTPAETDRILYAGNLDLQKSTSINSMPLEVLPFVLKITLSVDHLEVIGDEDVEFLKDSDTMPVALPSCSFS